MNEYPVSVLHPCMQNEGRTVYLRDTGSMWVLRDGKWESHDTGERVSALELNSRHGRETVVRKED